MKFYKYKQLQRCTFFGFDDLGLLIDSEIVLSTRYGKTMVFINKNLINRDRLSTRPYQQRPLINKVDSW